MYWLLLTVPFLVIAGICFLGHWNAERQGLTGRGCDDPTWFGFGCVWVILAVVPLIAGSVATLVSSSEQVYDEVELTKIEQFRTVYQSRSENLTQQFAHYLAEVYPQHESDIFSRIGPGDVDLYLVKYPELRSSETITALVQQIRQLEDDHYKQQLARAETVRDMRYKTRSPWLYQWLMRDVPVPEQ